MFLSAMRIIRRGEIEKSFYQLNLFVNDINSGDKQMRQIVINSLCFPPFDKHFPLFYEDVKIAVAITYRVIGRRMKIKIFTRSQCWRRDEESYKRKQLLTLDIKCCVDLLRNRVKNHTQGEHYNACGKRSHSDEKDECRVQKSVGAEEQKIWDY